MKKRIGKSIGDARKRLHEAESAYLRALVAYKRWLDKERGVVNLKDVKSFSIDDLRKKGKKK